MVGVGLFGHLGHDERNGPLGLASRPALGPVTGAGAGAVPGRSVGRVAFHAAAHVLTSGFVCLIAVPTLAPAALDIKHLFDAPQKMSDPSGTTESHERSIEL